VFVVEGFSYEGSGLSLFGHELGVINWMNGEMEGVI
jgi:hypothetical protein